jgi:rhodanese-related sulfurtransferase
MPFNNSIPEISPVEVARKIKSCAEFIFLDVRELSEFEIVRIDDPRIHFVPMTRLSTEGFDALPEQARDKNQEIIVFCHHGIRSAQVVAWLKQNGWREPLNMSGGIDAYARLADPAIGRY